MVIMSRMLFGIIHTNLASTLQLGILNELVNAICAATNKQLSSAVKPTRKCTCIVRVMSFFTWSHGQWFVSKETLFSGYPLWLGLFTTMNPWHCAITITYTESPDVLKSELNVLGIYNRFPWSLYNLHIYSEWELSKSTWLTKNATI